MCTRQFLEASAQVRVVAGPSGGGISGFKEIPPPHGGGITFENRGLAHKFGTVQRQPCPECMNSLCVSYILSQTVNVG